MENRWTLDMGCDPVPSMVKGHRGEELLSAGTLDRTIHLPKAGFKKQTLNVELVRRNLRLSSRRRICAEKLPHARISLWRRGRSELSVGEMPASAQRPIQLHNHKSLFSLRLRQSQLRRKELLLCLEHPEIAGK